MLHTGIGSICCHEEGQAVEILPVKVTTAALIGNQFYRSSDRTATILSMLLATEPAQLELVWKF